MAKSAQAEFLTIDGPAGPLQAVLETPPGVPPAACAVVCHPHPLHGGSMQNKVVHTLARAFNHRHQAALRFNFRGVGESAGTFDDGEGELLDTRAVIAWLRQRHPGLPLWLAGFSFGAAVSIRAAVDTAPAGLISVAPAVSRFAGSLPWQPQCPWLIVQGDRDELVPVGDTIAWVNRLEPGPELCVLPAAEHFFHGKLVALREVAERFVAAQDGSANEKPGHAAPVS